MTRPLNLDDIMGTERIAERIADKWTEWDNQRRPWAEQAKELRDYLFATDTKTTTNSKLPWKNSTTVPKLSAIRDILHSHYMSAIFPNDDWFVWQARDQDSANKKKAQAITAYMKVKLDQNGFRSEVSRLVYDFIDYGNCFALAGFRREIRETPSGQHLTFEGPINRRISPYDIVFDPTVERFEDSPKIIREMTTVGELLLRLEDDPGLNFDKSKIDKLVEGKRTLQGYPDTRLRNARGLRLDGFGDAYTYAQSDAVEILEFQGDWYDGDANEIHRNQIITILDRRYVLRIQDQDSYMKNTIFHVGWRLRPDNLWAMGPLDNLVGMQYRIDHIENAKADAIDQYIHPIKKIKGLVEEFEDRPGENIFLGDDGDVIFERPDAGALQDNQEISYYFALMEEMAGAPKDLAGVRTPGNKTLFEVEQLQTNSQRLFLNKTSYFEEEFLEKLLNSMLDISVRRMSDREQIAVPNDDFGVVEFMDITPEDLSGNGLIRPVGARRFQTQEKLIQNLTNFAASPIGQDPAVSTHVSGVKLAQMFEELLGIERWGLVRPNVRIAEQAETARLAQSAQEEVQVEGTVPTEITETDVDIEEEL